MLSEPIIDRHTVTVGIWCIVPRTSICAQSVVVSFDDVSRYCLICRSSPFHRPNEMPLTPSERMRRFREKLKRTGSYAEVQKKDRLRHQMKRATLTASARVVVKRRDSDRKKAKADAISPQVLDSAFGSKQAFGKALNKAMSALPVQSEKKLEIVNALSKKSGIIAPTRHQRVTTQLVSHTDDIYLFVCRA